MSQSLLTKIGTEKSINQPKKTSIENEMISVFIKYSEINSNSVRVLQSYY